MKVEFKKSFVKDLKKIRDQKLLNNVGKIIEQVEQVSSLEEIAHLKKLKGDDCYYRIRLENYRIGLYVKNDLVSVVRFLHRKDMYTYFP